MRVEARAHTRHSRASTAAGVTRAHANRAHVRLVIRQGRFLLNEAAQQPSGSNVVVPVRQTPVGKRVRVLGVRIDCAHIARKGAQVLVTRADNAHADVLAQPAQVHVHAQIKLRGIAEVVDVRIQIGCALGVFLAHLGSDIRVCRVGHAFAKQEAAGA